MRPPHPAPHTPPRSSPVPATAFPLPEILIAGAYFLAATTWIIASDLALESLAGVDHGSSHLQTLKGLNFVLTTAALLYVLLRRLYSRRRAAEQAVRDQAERFELMARATSDLLWDLDLRTQRAWWSQDLSDTFSPAPAELTPTLEAWYDHIHPEDRDRVRDGIQSALTHPAGRWLHQYRFRRRDGSYATVVGRGRIVTSHGGEPVRIIGGITDVSARVEADRQLARNRERLRALTARLERLREEERTRIAREIHDELGQLLTGLRMNLRWAENHLAEGAWPPASNALLDRLVEATELTDQVLASVRRIAADLRPSVLDTLGLAEALRVEAAAFTARSNVPCTLDLPDSLPQLSPDARTTVFRIFQESLTNVARHAQATQVHASFQVHDHHASLRIQDNGVGLQSSTPEAPSLGLLGMQERAEALGGTVTLANGAPTGTLVTFKFPLNSPNPAHPPPHETHPDHR